MQRDVIVKGRSLGGSSDLTLLAPIKPGFVESLESVTYKTRVKRVLETLHTARMASHEHAMARLLSDAVERVGAIHSVRVAVLEPEDKVMLVVTFDGNWEAYIRVLWDKVGTLLDLIFCGTVDYVTSYEHTFEEWAGWARRVQIETGFFYGPPDSTARDVLYHRRIERMRQRGLGSEINELRAVMPTAEDAVHVPDGGYADDPPTPAIDEFSVVRPVAESVKYGLQALAGLYRLTDLFRPGTSDGDTLRCATICLLNEFAKLCNTALSAKDIEEARRRFSLQLDWLFPDGNYGVTVHRAAQPFPEIDDEVRADIQGGILQAYNGVTHGAALMLAFDSPLAAHRFLAYIGERTTRDMDLHEAAPGKVFTNVALTLAGLRASGVSEDDLELFPEDFRQGMAARAGSLGDVRNNHPRRWRLPRSFLGPDSEPGPASIDIATVHAVLQLRCKAHGDEEAAALDYWDPHHPLRHEIQAMEGQNIDGLRILAIQSLRRQYREQDGKPVIVEHFGYADGSGQPDLSGNPSNKSRVHLGEVILGHNNAADKAIDLSDPCVPEATKVRVRWLKNGSFLVLRKYRQYVERLHAAVLAAAKEMGSQSGKPQDECAKEVYAKLMGRYPDGTPLAKRDSADLNDFTFNDDLRGQVCPLHAHIRRAHPRTKPPGSARPPRLMRRSMSYGPASDQGEADRGLIFMAYNASFSEQFEVVQRWLAGGNSTGSSSGQSCPIVGVPDNGFTRRYRFEYGPEDHEQVLGVELERQCNPFDEPEPIARLEWGLYLFTPAISGLQHLCHVAIAAAAKMPAAASPSWRTARGRELLQALEGIELREGHAGAIAAWKAAIEDPEAIDRLDSASLWAAIREDHAGVLRTPYGVLVASRELQLQVYHDRDRYSVMGQRERMRISIGDISLGKDAGKQDGNEYEEESAPINSVIQALDPEQVFALARTATDRKIDCVVKDATKLARGVGNGVYEVSFDAREVVDEVLADLGEHWFGMREPFFRRGAADWAWKPTDPPLYPGHFTALSRYMFQPHPGPVPTELGQTYGAALRKAMLKFVQEHRRAGTLPEGPDGQPAPIAVATFNHPKLGKCDEFVASTMVGVLMGFTPTIIGAVLNVLKEWRSDGRFGALHAQCSAEPIRTLAQAYRLLHAPMAAAAQMRPMPQIGWRTARTPHRLGPPGRHCVDVEAGDKIVLAMVSGTQQSLADGEPDGRLMFGGVRETVNHPTHACPGYHAGIAAMLGTLAALVSRQEDIRDGLAPLAFEVRGDSGFRPKPAPLAPMGLSNASIEGVEIPARDSRTGLVLAWGDSWLGFAETGPFAFDLRDWLARWGYTAPKDYCGFREWLYLEKMAARRQEFNQFLMENIERSPRAILLSASGNDSVEGALETGLLYRKGDPRGVINHENLKLHISKLKAYYSMIMGDIERVLDKKGLNTPIIVHGYDHPIPIDRGPSRWIREPFWNMNYVDPLQPQVNTRCDLEAATPAMRDLIDALGEMQAALAQEHSHVRYVKLSGTVNELWPQDPTTGWFDNMHPNAEAFKWMAAKIAARIENPDG